MKPVRNVYAVVAGSIAAAIVVAAGAAFAQNTGAPAKSKAGAATVNLSHQQAMNDCMAMYAGPRGFLGKDRYAFIERCFKQKTGFYPADVGQNCTLRRC